jgi:hypothetical protein
LLEAYRALRAGEVGQAERAQLALLRRKYDGQEAPAPSSVPVLHSALLSEMCEALELCEDALAELSRLDDGTCSTSALFAARDVLAKARLRPGSTRRWVPTLSQSATKGETTMPKYTATFRTDADYAEQVFTTRTPKAALALARRFHEDRPEDLMFEEYTNGMPVDEIEISRDGDVLAVWRSGDLNQRLAAPDLLAALMAPTQAAQTVIDSWAHGDLAGAVNGLDHTIKAARAAILKAQGRAEAGAS